MQIHTSVVPPKCFPQSLHLTVGGAVYYLHLQHLTSGQILDGNEEGCSREHRHSVYHIVLYSKGNNQFVLQGQNQAIEPGTLVLVSPGQSHSFYPLIPHQPVVYYDLLFSFVTRENLPLEWSFNQLFSAYSGIDFPDSMGMIRVSKQQTERLESSFEQIMGELKTNDQRTHLSVTQKVHALFMVLINILCDHQMDFYVQNSPVQRISDYIESHFTQKISISQLAKIAGFSEGHFLRIFKQAKGVSPIEYQQELRIRAAQTLLKNSFLNCKEISFRVGYEDTCHFSKIFKKRVGMSPQSFREKDESCHFVSSFNQ